MSEQAIQPRRWPAWLWAAVVIALLFQQVGFWRHSRPDSDVLALLPGVKQDAMLTAANQQILEGATQQVVVLIGDADFNRAKSSAQVFLKAVPAGLLKPVIGDATGDVALDFYRPHRGSLLTAGQRQRLAHADIKPLADAALARLYGPGLAGGLTNWRADPLGLWPEWWQTRLGKGMQSRDGWISVSQGGIQWIVLRFNADSSTFRLDGVGRIHDALASASERTRSADPGVKIIEAGVPLHAEAAAVQASWEIKTIGYGSLLAVIVLAWMAFRSLWPILLIGLSLAIGTLAGIGVTTLVFGKVHALTLVFGTSLVGVAEDYGLLYFAIRQSRPDTPPRPLFRLLMPSMLLALTTSVLGYLALGLAPLPGLQQMAVFSASGLVAAFLTVACWFPGLDRSAPRSSGFARRVANSLPAWPRWRFSGTGIALALITTAVVLGGVSRLHTRDDLRSLQNSPPALLKQEIEVGRLLGLPSPAQFYLISGANAEEVLRREEQLTERLDGVVADGGIAGYRAVSDWVPSAARQQADAQLSTKVESAVLARVSTALSEPIAPASASTAPLSLDEWLKSPVSAPLRKLWLGSVDGQQGSLVMLQGLGLHSDLQRLQNLASSVPGVRWIDRTHDISELLGRYRQMMSLLLIAGYALVAAALAWRFKRRAWRTLLPTALAGVLSLALIGWLGEPLQLFTVLAEFLLLGVGVDYGIFLIEHQDDPATWLAVSLGAANTVLSFGLLALSATPALHTFGLTMLFGIGFAWLLSPCFRPVIGQNGQQIVTP